MKKYFFLISILVTGIFTHAQVSTVVDGFSTNLTKSDLPFSGDRKLHAIGLNDRNTNNYIVVSKNKSGAADDELYIEKFTKKDGNEFERTFSVKLTHPVNKSLAFVNNRMSYRDADKDGNAELIYIVDQHSNGVDSPVEKTYGIIMYNNAAYKIWKLAEDGFTKNYYDDNFSKLPAIVREGFEEFWNSLKH